jgi:hypothetical protein
MPPITFMEAWPCVAHSFVLAEEDVAQWTRESLPLEGTLQEAAQAVADRLEVEYSRQRLGVLAFAGGFEKDVEQLTVAAKDLAALEELEEDEEQ